MDVAQIHFFRDELEKFAAYIKAPNNPYIEGIDTNRKLTKNERRELKHMAAGALGYGAAAGGATYGTLSGISRLMGDTPSRRSLLMASAAPAVAGVMYGAQRGLDRAKATKTKRRKKK